MRRLAQFVGLLALGLLIGSLSAQQPGTYVIRHEFLVPNGCLASQNDVQYLKKNGLCRLGFIAENIKLKGLECHAHLSEADTLVDCTYLKAVATDAKAPNIPVGFTLFPELSVGPDGCVAEVNNPGNMLVLGKCGFNVNLQGLSIPNATCTVRVAGNTTVECEYPPVRP